MIKWFIYGIFILNLFFFCFCQISFCCIGRSFHRIFFSFCGCVVHIGCFKLFSALISQNFVIKLKSILLVSLSNVRVFVLLILQVDYPSGCVCIGDFARFGSPMQWDAMWPRMMVSACRDRASSFLFVKRNENQRSESSRWVLVFSYLFCFFSLSLVRLAINSQSFVQVAEFNLFIAHKHTNWIKLH